MAKDFLVELSQTFDKLSRNKDLLSIELEFKALKRPDLSLMEDFVKNFSDAVEKAHSTALLLLAADLELALAMAMKDNVWDWDYGDGDIYDTGALQKSGRVVVSGDSLQVLYDEEYAAIVHYGGYIYPYGNPNVSIYMPGRPWVQSVILGGGPVPQFDMQGTYNKYATPLIEQAMKSFGY